MTRFELETKGDMLEWLLARDNQPQPVPAFPSTIDRGLVVAQLVAGKVKAEVITSAEQLVALAGKQLPHGRLYFQIDKSALYSICPALVPD